MHAMVGALWEMHDRNMLKTEYVASFVYVPTLFTHALFPLRFYETLLGEYTQYCP